MQLDRVAALFEENFTNFGELGASVSIWHRGREVLSLASGFQDRERTTKWVAETPALVWSATKGLAAACALHACSTRGCSLSTAVAEVWPEFSAGGKQRNHPCGAALPSGRAFALSREVPVLDYQAVIDALAAEAPHWPPGEGHGYHPRTFGFLLDEIVRRLTAFPLASTGGAVSPNRSR
jgi:CubicO group peptidase (beta-lactamase class C family)